MTKYDYRDAILSYVEKTWFTGQDMRQIRIDAVHSVSKKYGVTYQAVLSSCTRGFYRTAEEFDDWLERKLIGPSPEEPTPPSDDASTRAQKAWKTRRQKQQAEVKADEPSAEKDESPTDESADWRDDLLDTLQNMPPDAFERLCQRLLRESGFIEVEVTEKSGDGGIDGYGIIRLAGMISFPVLFQCKRYSGNVGSNVVRDFRGAMAGRAEKGVILTTGAFTRDAQREATRDGAAPVDLIDGQLLTDKMKSLKLGVHTKTVEVVQVDKHWFESFSR